MEKVDHSKFAWKAQNNAMGNLGLKSKTSTVRNSRTVQLESGRHDGLTKAGRRKLDEELDRQLYPELYEGDVF